MARCLLERPDATLVGTRVGEGPGVLLLHAGGERREVWRPIADILAGRGHRCVAYDLRGHGDSGAAGADRLPTHADDVAAMIAAEPGPVTVVGSSLGGLAALLALEDPTVGRAVAGVVLVDVGAHLDPARVRRYLDGVRAGYGEQPLVRDVLNRRDRLTAATRGLADQPTLLVRAGRSALGEHDWERFTGQLPHAAVATVAAAGHLVARDAPTDLATLLLGHLDSPGVRHRRTGLLLDAAPVHRIPHPGGNLREHLDRTADLLEAWGAPGWVVDAGRLHAAHGTDGFPDGIPGLTAAAIRATAGAEAADLVELYGRCDRARSYPTLDTGEPVIVDRHTGEVHRLTPRRLSAFVELTAANELDVVRHSPAVAAEHGPGLGRLFDRLAPILSPAARAAWSAHPAGSPG